MKSFLPSGGRHVECVFRHASHVAVDVILLGFHGWRLEVEIENVCAVERESFKHIFERDAVVGLFPHLLCKIEMALRGLEIGINAERDRAIYDELRRIEERHEELDGVAFVVRHFFPVVEIFL